MSSSYATAIAAMNQLVGFDVIIVCTGDDMQASYWQERLEAAAGTIISRGAVVLGVSEDWNGGAGNALGTLYAFSKAAALAQRTKGLDLRAELEAKKISVGLYHTAGKGTRLSPLPGAENNNKPAVKLPVPGNLTILEAVVKQTGVYGPARKGRLSVFWGDQVFIPSQSYALAPTHDIDILCKIGPMPSSSAEWEEKGLHKYGLIAVGESGEAAQVEKVTYGVALELLKELGSVKAAGPSLGSFSVSFAMLSALLGEFAPELARKNESLDTDPHLWMPLTLEQPAYVEIMAKKGMGAAAAAAHHARMRKMRAGMPPTGLGLFGAVDVGADAYWWDYGQLKLYADNNARMADDDAEAGMMREFYGFRRGARVSRSKLGDDVATDGASVLSGCDLGAGEIERSLLAGVTACKIEAHSAIVVNVTAPSVVAAKGALAYNVISDGPLVLGEGEVLAGVFSTTGELTVVKSHKDTDGGKVWKQAVHGNARSFEAIHLDNKGADVRRIGELGAAKHAAAREPIAKSNKECRGPFGLPAQLSVPALGAVDTKASLLVIGLAATTFAVLSLFKRS